MKSYFYEESKLNVPLGFSLSLLVLVCSIVLADTQTSVTPQVLFVTQIGSLLFNILLGCYLLISYNYMFFSRFILQSQNGYGHSKYEKRKKNATKASARRARAQLAKQRRELDLPKPKDPRAYTSQASKQDMANMSIDLSDYMLDMLGPIWYRFREMSTRYGANIAKFDFTKIATFLVENWESIRSCELFALISVLMSMAISLGWIENIDFKVKGITLFSPDPLRKKVSIWDFLEALTKLYKLCIEIGVKVITTGDVTLCWKDEQKNAYDDEFTYLKSQKPLIDLGRMADIDEVTYDRRVCECIATTLALLNACKDSERNYYSTRLCILRDIMSARALAKKDYIREKPLGVLLYGGSGVGKSAIVNALVYYVLACNGKDSSPRATVTLNMEDSYQSEFETKHAGVIFDDILNASLDYCTTSPTTPIIMFLNNVPMAALSPIAEMKGKNMIEPDVVFGTTNVKDLLSNQLSNEPLSINRRFELTITQEVKPEYRKEGTLMLDPNKVKHMKNDSFPDYALFTVEEPSYAKDYTESTSKSGKTKKVVFKPLKYKGKTYEKIEIATLLEFLRDYSAEFYETQKDFVAGQRKLRDHKLCEHKMPTGMCKECKAAAEEQEPIEEVPDVQEASDDESSVEGSISDDKPLESQAGIEYYHEVVTFLTDLEVDVCSWISFAIVRILSSKYGGAIIAYFHKHLFLEVVVSFLPKYFCGLIGGWTWIHFWHLLKWHYGYWYIPLLTEMMWATFCTMVLLYYSYQELDKRRQEIIIEWSTFPLPSVWLKTITWKTKFRIVIFLGSIGVWKIIIEIVKQYNALPTKQSAAPIPLPKPNMKDYQKETEFWDTRAAEAKYKFGTAGTTEKSRTISQTLFESMFGKRMLHVAKEDHNCCNAIPLKSNVLLIPNHFVSNVTDYVTMTKVGGHTFKDIPLDTTCTYHIPFTDFAVWYAPGAGLHKDIIEYYPKEIYDGKLLSVYTLYNKVGELIRYAGMTARKERVVTTEGGIFSGLKYTFPQNTFGGLCMGTLVGEANGIPFIAGHHLAGIGTEGAAGFLTRKMLYEAIEKLEKKPSVLVSHSAVPMETETLGVEFGPLTAPHDKCVVNDLPMDAKIRVHGSHTMPRSSPKANVMTSLISEAATKVMKIEKIHGEPLNFGATKHKVIDIAGKVDTASRFDGTLVQKAYIDYSCQLDKLPKSELAMVGKISDDVNLAGADGVIGLNAMNFNTSIGWPLKGPKTKYVTKSDRVVEGISCVRDADPRILEEVARMEAELLAGKSVNTVFKAAFKSEARKLSKDKQRVFAAANTAFVMLVRKYFLTIAALVQRNKEITECAVGTVVQSPEWTELYNHIGKNGWDRAIAGDYAKFDGKMSVHFMLMSFKLMIKIAEKSGNYDADDITIMKGIATEISYPTYDYFGTLVQFFGSNPSGHPMTVIVNSMVNSLYMRYTYYSIAKKKGWWKTPLFSNVVALMTYGDDNIMTVLKGYDDFNHTAIAAEFEEVGITYTMADKDAESVPFVNLSDASFLKHFAVWDEELGLYRSPVEDGSIAKMLHTHARSQVLTVEQSSAEAIQNVALKYFECGREVYTKRVAELNQVALDSGVSSYVVPIPTYDERLAWYRNKFDL